MMVFYLLSVSEIIPAHYDMINAQFDAVIEEEYHHGKTIFSDEAFAQIREDLCRICGCCLLVQKGIACKRNPKKINFFQNTSSAQKHKKLLAVMKINICKRKVFCLLTGAFLI